MAPRVGLEPTAYRLTAGCSTIELPWNKFISYRGRKHIFTIVISANETSDDLLSQGAAPQVPSALKSLTAVFGMGTGVTSLPSSLDFVLRR